MKRIFNEYKDLFACILLYLVFEICLYYFFIYGFSPDVIGIILLCFCVSAFLSYLTAAFIFIMRLIKKQSRKNIITFAGVFLIFIIEYALIASEKRQQSMRTINYYIHRSLLNAEVVRICNNSFPARISRSESQNNKFITINCQIPQDRIKSVKSCVVYYDTNNKIAGIQIKLIDVRDSFLYLDENHRIDMLKEQFPNVSRIYALNNSWAYLQNAGL